jgi:O-antigen ligase
MLFLREKLIPLLINTGIILILFSPFPYGTVEARSISFFEIVSFLTFALWIAREAMKGEIRLPPSPFYIPMWLFFLFIIFQLLPLPLSVIRTISPHAAALWEGKKAAFKEIFGGSEGLSYTLSLYPYATREKLFLYISYALFFLITTSYVVKRDQIKRLFWVVFTVAVLESAIGLFEYLTGGAKLPVGSSYLGRVSGTYVNPNHFAGFLGMVIPISLGYGFSFRRDLSENGGAWQRFFTISFTQFLIFFGAVFMAISLVLSKSRGGIISFVVSIVFFYLFLSRGRGDRLRSSWTIGFFLLVVILYALWIGLDPVIQKFIETKETLPARTLVWRDTLRLIRDFPICGTGLGSYGLTYTLYKKSYTGPFSYTHAHNDYLELAAETGLVGFALVIYSIIAFYRRAWVSLRLSSSKPDPLRYSLTIGCLSGVFAILVHALTEFNLQIPANAFYLSFLLGLSTSLLYHLSGEKRV